MELITWVITILAMFMVGVSIRLEGHVRQTKDLFKVQDGWILDELENTKEILERSNRHLKTVNKILTEMERAKEATDYHSRDIHDVYH